MHRLSKPLLRANVRRSLEGNSGLISDNIHHLLPFTSLPEPWCPPPGLPTAAEIPGRRAFESFDPCAPYFRSLSVLDRRIDKGTLCLRQYSTFNERDPSCRWKTSVKQGKISCFTKSLEDRCLPDRKEVLFWKRKHSNVSQLCSKPCRTRSMPLLSLNKPTVPLDRKKDILFSAKQQSLKTVPQLRLDSKSSIKGENHNKKPENFEDSKRETF